MFSQILTTQLRWTRTLLVGLGILAFLLPVGAWNIASGGRVEGDAMAFALPFIEGFSLVGPLAVIIALLSGFLMAALPWGQDHQGRHVYALSLPIRWSRYVGMRYVAGAVLLATTAIALLAGSLLALSLVTLPPVLRAYPFAFATRFFVATLLAYSLSFALQYLGGKRAAPILLGILVTWLVGGIVLDLIGLDALSGAIVRFMMQWPGPFAIFSEPWRLVDV